MKSLILLLLLAILSTAQADIFVAYVVRGAPDLFTGATDADIISRITGPDAVLEVYVETDSKSPQGTVQTHKIEYVEAWDEADKPSSKATIEVGTIFKVTEDEDKISFQFSHTTLERWISFAPSGMRLKPVFQSLAVNSDVVLAKGSRIVLGGLEVEDLHQGNLRKFVQHVIIERKSNAPNGIGTPLAGRPSHTTERTDLPVPGTADRSRTRRVGCTGAELAENSEAVGLGEQLGSPTVCGM